MKFVLKREARRHGPAFWITLGGGLSTHHGDSDLLLCPECLDVSELRFWVDRRKRELDDVLAEAERAARE